jgi:hypothetical protein
MNSKLLLATAMTAALLSSTTVLAADASAATPAKTQTMAGPAQQNAMSANASGGTAMSDDTCGTPVPGHHPIHSNWGSSATRTNTAAHCNSMKANTAGAMTH